MEEITTMASAMEEAITTAVFAWIFAVFMFLLYGLPMLGIVVGSIIVKKSASLKKWGVALIVVSAVFLVALVINVISNGIKFGF